MPTAAPAIDHSAPIKGTATGREFVALVTALMAMTALGIDLMLPAFPDIRAEFGMADVAEEDLAAVFALDDEVVEILRSGQPAERA